MIGEVRGRETYSFSSVSLDMISYEKKDMISYEKKVMISYEKKEMISYYLGKTKKANSSLLYKSISFS